MAIIFPKEPYDGIIFTAGEGRWTWDGTAWNLLPDTSSSTGNTTVTVSDAVPESPVDGNLWLNTDNGILYVYVDDGDSEQWIQPAVPTTDLTNYATKTYVDSAVSAAEFQLSVSGDDSTVRTISSNDTIRFLGNGTVTTEVDADGNVTITGDVSFSGDYNDLDNKPSIPDIGSLVFSGASIDSNDSSAISIIPAAVFNSDVTVENELTTNILVSPNADLVYIESYNFNIGLDLNERSKTQLDDGNLGTIKTLAMFGGFVGNRSTNPTTDEGNRLPIDTNFTGTVTPSDATNIARFFDSSQTALGRWALQSAWGDQVCGLAFVAGTGLDTLKYSVGRTDYIDDPFQTNAVVLGYQTGPRILVQKNHIGNNDPLDPEFSGSRSDVISLVGATDVLGTLKIDGVLNVGGTAVLRKTAEPIQTITGATSTVDHDTSVSSVFVHQAPAANFTANFTNMSTDDENSYSIAILINQGASPYIVNAVEIDGAAQSINWAGGSPPVGTANYVDVMNFSLIRTGSSWIVLGSLTTYN